MFYVVDTHGKGTVGLYFYITVYRGFQGLYDISLLLCYPIFLQVSNFSFLLSRYSRIHPAYTFVHIAQLGERPADEQGLQDPDQVLGGGGGGGGASSLFASSVHLAGSQRSARLGVTNVSTQQAPDGPSGLCA